MFVLNRREVLLLDTNYGDFNFGKCNTSQRECPKEQTTESRRHYRNWEADDSADKKDRVERNIGRLALTMNETESDLSDNEKYIYSRDMEDLMKIVSRLNII